MTAIRVTTADLGVKRASLGGNVPPRRLSHPNRASGNNLRNSQLRIFLIFLTTDMQLT